MSKSIHRFRQAAGFALASTITMILTVLWAWWFVGVLFTEFGWSS